MSGLVKCPECGKLISLRFPVHVCKPPKPKRTKLPRRSYEQNA